MDPHLPRTFVESFSYGLDPEIKSRLPKIDASTASTACIALALSVVAPLEAAARTKPAPAPRPHIPRPAANLDEASFADTNNAGADSASDMSDRELANYQRSGLCKEDRRAFRLARGACT